MPLTKESTISKIEVLANGVIQVQRKDSIMEDGAELAASYHRHCIERGADLTGEDAKVVAVATAAWA